MTAAELKEILESPEFKQELGDLSSYLASITHERPIVFLLAKCLWKRKKHFFVLEDGHSDLTVGKKKVEFKFNYDACAEKLGKELTKCGNTLDGIKAAVAAERHDFGRMSRIYKDICIKRPDIFVWIICERDFSNMNGFDHVRMNQCRLQKKHNENYPYKSSRAFLTIIDGFLEKLQADRPFLVTTAEVEANGHFPSTYYFRICDFSREA